MSRPRSRPLFLHSTALCDAEYAIYVEALCDILECPEQGSSGGDNSNLSDEELEARMVGMREARAWMRGRYKDVSVNDIDKILHFFKPHVQGDRIAGGQYFAALRLLMHLRNGSEVNENLVYVQINPTSAQVEKPPLHLNPNTSAVGLPTPALSVTFSNQQVPNPLPAAPATNLLSTSSSTSQLATPSASVIKVTQPPFGNRATASIDTSDVRRTFSCLPCAPTNIPTTPSTSTLNPPAPAPVNSAEDAFPAPSAETNLGCIKSKLLELRQRALVFASYEDMLGRDPALVKEIALSFAELKREQETAMNVLKRTQTNDAKPSSKKTNGKRVYSSVVDIRNKKQNLLKKTARQLLRSQLREITENANLEMSYANYETNIVLKYGVELVGWPLPTFSFNRYGRIPLQGVVDGLTNGSIRWVKLSDEQLAARVQAWKAKEDSGVQDVTKKRKRAAHEDDDVAIVANDEEFRSAVRLMLEGDSTLASAEDVRA